LLLMFLSCFNQQNEREIEEDEAMTKNNNNNIKNPLKDSLIK